MAAPDAGDNGARSVEIDGRAFRRNRNRAAPTFEATSQLADEVALRMAERLDLVRLPEGSVLDLGSGPGGGTDRLAERYPGRTVVGLDPAEQLLRARRAGRRGGWLTSLLRPKPLQVCADLEHLPFRPGSFALVWSNLVLQWLRHPETSWRAIGSLLRGGGLLMFSTLGPDSLAEIRRAWRTTGRPGNCLPFADMHDIGDSLVHAGFAAPVMDMEVITVRYPSAAAVVADLRGQGAANVRADRSRGLLAPARWNRFVEALATAGTDGEVVLRLEIVYGHAWWPDGGPAKTADGRDVVRIQGLGRRRKDS